MNQASMGSCLEPAFPRARCRFDRSFEGLGGVMAGASPTVAGFLATSFSTMIEIARQRCASRRCARASGRQWRGWCGGCRCRRPRSNGHCGRGLSRWPRCGSRVACGRQSAPNESSPRRYGSFQLVVLCWGFGLLGRRQCCCGAWRRNGQASLPGHTRLNT